LYASAYANDIELIVKYKDNQNKTGAVFSANSVGTSQAQNYQVLEDIDSRIKIVKVNDGQPLQPTTTSLKTQSSVRCKRHQTVMLMQLLKVLWIVIQMLNMLSQKIQKCMLMI